MPKIIQINVGPGETRVAVTGDSRLEEFYVERTAGLEDPSGRAGHSVLGNIILGRVQRVLPAMQAAFVEIGLERAGFLGAKEARCLADLPGFRDALPDISDCVHEGEAILVQVIKDPIGEKGARLSANFTLPGRLLVLVPHQKGVALSRRIEDDAERTRLTQLVEAIGARPGALKDAGYIVRTVATGASEAELIEDTERLAAEWRELEARRAAARPPATLYCDLDPIARTLRDCVDADVTQVLIDDAAALEEARAYAAEAMPDVLPLIALSPQPLFDADTEGQIEQLLNPRVALASGGWITIECTEALTAIDVNSGSFTASTGLEETSLRINLDAAAEIARQLRLRAIGGLVIIDFIHLGECENIAKVLQVLALGLGCDRVPTQIAPMSEFGIVQLTRKRVRDPLVRFLTEPARSCLPGGRIKTATTIANEFLRRIEREALANPGRTIDAAAHPEIAAFVSATPELCARLRARIGARFRIRARDGLARDRFDCAVEQAQAATTA